MAPRGYSDLALAAARMAWASFDDDQKATLRFGLIPIEAAEIANDLDPEISQRELALALFDVARENGQRLIV